MRVALVSDIHSNPVALDAVLADIDRAGTDQIVCLGDVATLGPQPIGVLDRLRTLGCLCIRGNHDDYLLEAELTDTHNESPLIRDAIDWSRDQLSADDLGFVAGFVDGAEIDLGCGVTLTVFHGAPACNTTDLLATTPATELDGHLDGAGQVASGGHTHIQMMRQHRGRLLVNPGSVGMPFREYSAPAPPTLVPGIAEYGIVEGSEHGVGVTLRRVPVDADAFLESCAGSENPLVPAILTFWT